MRNAHGKQYWMKGGLAAWTEGTGKVGRGVTEVVAALDASHVRITCSDQNARKDGEVLLASTSDVLYEGRYNVGRDAGSVSARLFRNSEGVLPLGTWTDDEGAWLWMADLVFDSSEPALRPTAT